MSNEVNCLEMLYIRRKKASLTPTRLRRSIDVSYEARRLTDRHHHRKQKPSGKTLRRCLPMLGELETQFDGQPKERRREALTKSRCCRSRGRFPHAPRT
ncbi:hypothetical protein BJX68DRAFT_170545 [Aspergillus pseudodeflectus]|uniref:Uncharacterized protein n=1 Tax=Aspergillus pseudodeflectus TaxID=176178 RepID=A0ABR4JNN2_9EURO